MKEATEWVSGGEICPGLKEQGAGIEGDPRQARQQEPFPPGRFSLPSRREKAQEPSSGFSTQNEQS